MHFDCLCPPHFKVMNSFNEHLTTCVSGGGDFIYICSIYNSVYNKVGMLANLFLTPDGGISPLIIVVLPARSRLLIQQCLKIVDCVCLFNVQLPTLLNSPRNMTMYDLPLVWFLYNKDSFLHYLKFKIGCKVHIIHVVTVYNVVK